MSILGLQRRIAEVGRIRIGQQVPTQSGKTRPAKLDTFRITSSDRQRIEQIARMYGGQVQPWKSPNGDQWEVITDTDVLPVIVPPAIMAFSQCFEQWSAGGCVKRCDGQHEAISDGPCLCDPDNRECDIHTRLSVMLKDVPGLGVYRIDSSGYYAAVELSGAVEIISMAVSRGQMLPARLRLEQRSVKRQHNGKPETRRFPVPVLDIDIAPGQLILGTASPDMELTQLEDPRPPSQDAITAAAPRKTIAEQIADDNVEFAKAKQQPAELPAPAPYPSPVHAPAQRPSRRAPAIPATGVKPRTAAQVKAAALPPSNLISEGQRKFLYALLTRNGLAGEENRERALEAYAKILGHPVKSTRDLTVDEGSQLIDTFRKLDLAYSEKNLEDPQDRLIVASQVVHDPDLPSALTLTNNQVQNVLDVLESVMAPDPPDSATFISRLAAAISPDKNIDPETGEEVPDLDQPTLNGDR